MLGVLLTSYSKQLVTHIFGTSAEVDTFDILGRPISKNQVDAMCALGTVYFIYSKKLAYALASFLNFA
jgi:hypothetical protein